MFNIRSTTTGADVQNAAGSSGSIKRFAAAGVAATLIGAGAVGTHISADDSDESDTQAPPGVPLGDADFQLGQGDLVQTSGSTFDNTTLRKSIPAMGFVARQGENNTADTTITEDDCISAGPNTGGTATQVWAPVELPDGSRIDRVIFYGHDNDPASDIEISLHRQQVAINQLSVVGQPPPVTREHTEVTSFTTEDAQDDASVFASDANLGELTGTPRLPDEFLGQALHRFHSIEVVLREAAGALHLLCGVEVLYHVPTSSADAGTVFHPLEPYRAFDSRRESFAQGGLLAPNTSKIVSVADGYDDDGVAIPAQAGLVPATATAVTYNITVSGTTGANFVAVTPGGATEFTASAINYNPGANIANAGTVSVDDEQQIKLWGGNGFGSGNVIIDITGYYAPAPPLPNMGN